MRLPQTRTDPRGLPPIRNLLPPPGESMPLCPVPRSRLVDRLTWVLVALYAVLAISLIAGGTSPRVACYTIGHVLELGCAGR